MPPELPRRRLDPAWSGPVFFICLGLAFIAIPLYHAFTKPNCSGNKDYTFWYEIGQDVRADLPIYRPMFTGELKYMYPPTLAVLVYAPLTHLGPVGFVLALGMISACAWAVSLWASLKLIAGRWPGHPRWLYVVPGLAIAAYVWDIQLLGQVNLILLAEVLLAMLALSRGKPITAGVFLGAAAAMKAFPLTAIAYFVVRREWKAVAATIIATLCFAWFFPSLLRGFDRTTSELRQWAGHMVADQSGTTIGARAGIAFTRRNHSVVSLTHRLLREVNAGDRAGEIYTVNFANISPQAAQRIGYGFVLGLGVVLLASARLRFATTPLAEGLEVSMVCILVVLASPMSFTYFYCWLAPAWTAMAWLLHSNAVDRRTRSMIMAGTITAGVLLLLSVTEQVTPMFQAYGVTTWGSLALFFSIAYARWTLPNDHSQVVAAPIPLARAA